MFHFKGQMKKILVFNFCYLIPLPLPHYKNVHISQILKKITIRVTTVAFWEQLGLSKIFLWNVGRIRFEERKNGNRSGFKNFFDLWVQQRLRDRNATPWTLFINHHHRATAHKIIFQIFQFGWNDCQTKSFVSQNINTCHRVIVIYCKVLQKILDPWDEYFIGSMHHFKNKYRLNLISACQKFV